MAYMEYENIQVEIHINRVLKAKAFQSVSLFLPTLARMPYKTVL